MSLPVSVAGSYKNLTASGAVSTGRCHLVGFYVNSTNAGTIAFTDGGSGGTTVSGTITPAIGWHQFPVTFGTDCYATIAGTALNVTLSFIPTN